MGYMQNLTDVDFSIPADKTEAAAIALHECTSTGLADRHLPPPDLTEQLEQLGFVVGEANLVDGRWVHPAQGEPVSIEAYDGKGTELLDRALKVLARFAPAGSRMTWLGEDYDQWRLVVRDQELVEQYPDTTWRDAGPAPAVAAGAPGAALDGGNPLFAWLDELTERMNSGDRPKLVASPFGNHEIGYIDDPDLDDTEGPYALIGFSLPDQVFPNLDGDTYGQLTGLRLYL